MGYYTKYSIDWLIKDNEPGKMYDEKALKEQEIIQFLAEHEDNYYAIVNNGVLDNNLEPAKWYTWKTDVARLSKNFPDVLFTLRGEGEAACDVWLAYFLGGKCQHEIAEYVFGEFDERKLQVVSD